MLQSIVVGSLKYSTIQHDDLDQNGNGLFLSTPHMPYRSTSSSTREYVNSFVNTYILFSNCHVQSEWALEMYWNREIFICPCFFFNFLYKIILNKREQTQTRCVMMFQKNNNKKTFHLHFVCLFQNRTFVIEI